MSRSTAMPYLTDGERKYVRRLINALLKQDALISVHDGEGYAITLSEDRKAIFQAIGSTESDMIYARHKDGRKLGSFFLVYGNAYDGSEVIADHGVNAFCDAIWAEVSK